MLKAIRDNAKGVVAWIIVIIIIIPFALWGVNEYLDTGRDVTVARIGDREVLLGEYQNAYQRELAVRGGGSIDENLKRQVIDRIVNAEVLSRAALDAGFRVPDVMVSRRIQAMSDFQRDGSFDRELYGRLLASAGLSPAQFEDETRRNLMLEQFLGGIMDTALVTDAELDALLKLVEQQRNFAHLVLPASDYASRVQIDDAAIESHYQQNREQYAVPERVVARYLELSLGDIASSIEVDEETLRRFYEERKSEFTVGEERRAHHILIAVASSAGEEEIEAARAEAEELLAAIEAGASFEETAREHSDDSGSARSGGDLGFFNRGAMVGPFEDAVFAMQPGEVQGPVRSPFGFHLIRLDEARPGTVRSFEEVKAVLLDEYRNARAEEQFFDLTDRLADLTFEHSDTLEVAAEDLDLPIREIGPFSARQGTGIAAEAAFRETAFSTDVLEAGHNSPLLEMGQGRVVVLRIADRQPASFLSLEEVRGRIEETLRREQIAELARRDGEELKQRARDGQALEALAKEFGAEWHGSETVARNETSLDPMILDALFAMPRPVDDAKVLEGVSLPGGDFAVIALHEVIDGDPQSIRAGERMANRDAIAGLRGQLAVEAVLESLRERSKVRVYEDRL
jgi:peptidyl-prolyl cis-trans isomerase D